MSLCLLRQAMLSSGQGPELDKPKGASRAGGSSKMPDIRAPQGGAPHAASTTEQPGNAQVLCGPGDSGSSATRGAIAVPSQQAELQAEKTWACASDSSQLPRDLVDASAEAYQAAMDGSVSAGARPPIHPIGGSSATKAGA